MSDSTNKLGILLDEYSDDKSSRLALDELIGDVNLQAQLRRYQTIGQVMRHELPDQINSDFHHDVMARIDSLESESTSAVSAPLWLVASNWLGHWFKPLAGLAVAASVAVVSVTLWQSINPGSQPGTAQNQLANGELQRSQQLALQKLQTNAVPVSSTLGSGMHWKVTNDTPALQQKLNGYLVNHTEYSNSIQGLIPQARVAGFDAQ